MARYTLQSSAAVSAPGVIAWAINGYAFKSDRAAIERVVCEGWKVPTDAARALLTRTAPYSVEGESVVFVYPAEAESRPTPRPARKRARLTQDAVKSELRNLGLAFRRVESEFRVNYRGGTEETAYYTEDLEDALDTGRAMAAELAKRVQQLITIRVPVALARAHALESFAI